MADGVVVVKLGGELLEPAARLEAVAAALERAHRAASRLAIVHGGGRAIDTALRRAGIAPRQVNGLRITDEQTLDVVVSILAGLMNTRLVAALNAAGVPAVGLTGADARMVPGRLALPVVDASGASVSLGRVGDPDEDTDGTLVLRLIDAGYVPVIASITADRMGGLLNINADPFAAALAVALHADRLVIAGTTPGVLDDEGRSIPELDLAGAERLIASGGATAGMIAKLRACADAIGGGVGSVVVADGTSVEALTSAALGQRHNGATEIGRTREVEHA
jgi:acetylglutamate kinase